MTKHETNKINWIVVCVNEFARQKALPVKTAFQYLYEFGGIAFLMEHYEAEHTLSFSDAVEDLSIICEKNNGVLQ